MASTTGEPSDNFYGGNLSRKILVIQAKIRKGIVLRWKHRWENHSTRTGYWKAGKFLGLSDKLTSLLFS